MNHTRLNTRLLQRDGVEMMVMMVLVVEMMMITMKSISMTVTMATVSPLREGISPADFSLPESFSLSGVFPLRSGGRICFWSLPESYVFGGMIYEEVHRQRWARAATPCPGAAWPWPAPGAGVGPWWPPSGSPLGSVSLLSI